MEPQPVGQLLARVIGAAELFGDGPHSVLGLRSHQREHQMGFAREAAVEDAGGTS
nr:hypothetical protein [Nocardia flavorosea]